MIDLEDKVDKTVWLRHKETELAEIIESIRAINSSSHWKRLSFVFKEAINLLEKRLQEERDDKEIYRLQGQIGFAKVYTDFEKLLSKFENELASVQNQLKK